MQLWHLYQMTPAGGWSQWVSHGSPPGASEPYIGCGPLVTPNAARRLDLIMGFGATSPEEPWAHHSDGAQQRVDTDVDLVGRPARNHCGHQLRVGHPPRGRSGTVRRQRHRRTRARKLSAVAPRPGHHERRLAAVGADGRLELFTVAAGGSLWHIWETSLNGTWSEWTSHGQPAHSLGLSGIPVIAANSEGRLELLLTGNDFSYGTSIRSSRVKAGLTG